jgi:hypothetical protein
LLDLHATLHNPFGDRETDVPHELLLGKSALLLPLIGTTVAGQLLLPSSGFRKASSNGWQDVHLPSSQPTAYRQEATRA